MKIVINSCYGGFGLTLPAQKRYLELKNVEYNVAEGYSWDPITVEGLVFHDFNIDRDEPELVQVVEEMGKLSWGSYSELKVVEIPDDVNWELNEHDGREWIAEVHRTWQ